MTMELLDTEEEDEDDDNEDEDIEIEKYSEYIEKYCTENSHDTLLVDRLKPRLLAKPVFLTRSAHVLKCKLGVYKSAASTSGTVTASDPPTAGEDKSDAALLTKTDEASVTNPDSKSTMYAKPKTNETAVKYRRNAFKKARKTHQLVTKRMYDKFRKLNNKWLKEHSKTADCIDDWLLGELAGPSTKTVCIKESLLKKVPYHIFYRYKVVASTPAVAASAPSQVMSISLKKNGAAKNSELKKTEEADNDVSAKPAAANEKTKTEAN
jgi:paired amphipathic helix protein Sin3a